MNPSRRACLVAGVVLLGGARVAPCRAQPSPRPPDDEVARLQLRFAISLTNPVAHELRDQSMWLYAPASASASATQQLAALRVSMDHQLLHDSLGHRIVRLHFDRFPPLASKTVTMVAEVAMRAPPDNQALAEPQAWLGSERYIEAANPRIRSVAAELRRPSPRDSARAIYDWVRQQLRYEGYVADDRGALYALAARQGDCTEYACLAVALARANGIPARMVGGYVVAGSSAPRPQDYHDWAEVHVEGAWRLLDAQKEHWLAAPAHYVSFRFYRDQVTNPVGLAHRFRVEGDLQVRL